MPATVAVTTLVLVVTTVLTGHRVLTVGLRRIWYRFCLLYAVGTGLGYGARGAVGCCHSFLGDPGSMAPLSICKATLKKSCYIEHQTLIKTIWGICSLKESWDQVSPGNAEHLWCTNMHYEALGRVLGRQDFLLCSGGRWGSLNLLFFPQDILWDVSVHWKPVWEMPTQCIF